MEILPWTCVYMFLMYDFFPAVVLLIPDLKSSPRRATIERKHTKKHISNHDRNVLVKVTRRSTISTRCSVTQARKKNKKTPPFKLPVRTQPTLTYVRLSFGERLAHLVDGICQERCI